MRTNERKNGFTLIELSIVIVIIGFLVAGITVGASMIKQAQIRSVITDLQQYQAAYNNFIARFNAVPGDMQTASAFWPGTDPNTDPKSCVASGSATICNGDGDGLVKWANTASDNEVLKAWRHLALAEMISAGIQPIDSGNTGALKIGVSAPNSKIQNAGYFIAGASSGLNTGNSIGLNKFSPWRDNETNAVFLGFPTTGTTFTTAALRAEDAFNIDNKVDDGIIDPNGGTPLFRGANTGIFRAIDGEGLTNACVDSASGNYVVTDTANAVCVVGMALN